MEIFREKCSGEDYKNNKLFIEWHKAIKTDLNKFKIILEKYYDSVEKQKLLTVIDYIRNNVSNEFVEDDFILMKSTVEYFLFSFYEVTADMPTYVLLSKDYKKFLIATEEMECFDDEKFNEDERYGIYNYDYFYLKNNKVEHYHEAKKEYTTNYSDRFDNLYFYISDIKQSEEYYASLLRKTKTTKKLIKLDERRK